jgi:surfeit locus 1 family protein
VLRVLRRPVWAVGTVICLVLVALFVRLGVWQLDRHDDRRRHNAEMGARLDREPEPIDRLLAGGDDLELRRADATGAWDDGGTLFVRSRSHAGRPGYHVVTPLVLGDRALVVNRGWVPRPEAPAVDGEATVRGRLRRTQERGSVGPRDPAEGFLREIARVDLARIQQQYERLLVPWYLELEEPATDLPVPVPPPDLDAGPHLGYAGQWFAFAAIGAIGWVILLRRQRDDPSSRPGAVVAGREAGSPPA